MKILFYGDLQIDRSNTTYSEFVQATLEHLDSVVKDVKPDLMVNLGDVVDGFGLISVETLNYTYDWMKYLGHSLRSGVTPRQWIVKGNHDIGDRDGKHNTVHILTCDCANTVFEEFATPEIDGLGHVIVIPYTHNYARVRENLEKLAEWPIKAVIAHTDWFGIRPNIKSGYVSTDGLNAGRISELFPNVPIFTGHYHTPMDLGNLHVVGSPLHKDFNDVLTTIPRGFTIWDTESGEIKRIANPCTYYCAEVRADDSTSLQAQCEILTPNRDNLKVKIYVPPKLMREADALFEPFLWHSVYSTESVKCGVEHSADVDLHTDPSELVELGVSEASPDVYNIDLLRQYGQEAFR